MHFQWEYAWLSVWHIISQTTMRDRAIWFQRTTYRKLHIRSPMVTWLMTSRDPERSRSRSWPPISLKLNILKTVLDRQSVQIAHLKETLYFESNSHVTDDVTWPQKVKAATQYLWTLIPQKPCETDGCCKLTTYRKPYISKPMVTWLMMSLVQMVTA